MESIIKRVLKDEWQSIQQDVEKLAANKVKLRIEDKKKEVLKNINEAGILTPEEEHSWEYQFPLTMKKISQQINYDIKVRDYEELPDGRIQFELADSGLPDPIFVNKKFFNEIKTEMTKKLQSEGWREVSFEILDYDTGEDRKFLRVILGK